MEQGSQGGEGPVQGAQTDVWKIYSRRPVWEITDSSRSGLDRDSPQAGQIPVGIPSGHIAGDFRFAHPVDFDVAQAL